MKFVGFILLLGSALAGAADTGVKDVLSAFRREQIREPIKDHVLRLTPLDAPTKPTFLVPVRNTWLKPATLDFYVYRPGEKPKGLADCRGPEKQSVRFEKLLSLEAKDQDGDGLVDINGKASFLTAQGKSVEKAFLYKNDGVAGFRLSGGSGAAAKKKLGFALNSDCRFTGLDGGWWIAACPGEKDALQIRFRREGEIRYQIETTGASDIEVHGQDSRAVAVSYEGTECQVVKVIRLKDGGLAADTDCTNSTYCSLSHFPKAPECKGTVECGDGAGGFRWKREFDVCK